MRKLGIITTLLTAGWISVADIQPYPAQMQAVPPGPPVEGGNGLSAGTRIGATIGVPTLIGSTRAPGAAGTAGSSELSARPSVWSLDPE
jgi:hypothetical protein